MGLTTEPITAARIDDLGRLLATDRVADGCWCMWFITSVKAFHAGGPAENRAAFAGLLAADPRPLGLLAYHQGEPAGWCAVGPRGRYARALRTPTYRAAAADGRADIWLAPCLFVRRDLRGAGVGRALIAAAVDLARGAGAAALDSFPFARTHGRARGDTQVGFEPLFAACGFAPIGAPSPGRVVMRRELGP